MEAGDKVRLITKESEITGIVMPTQSKDSIFIKLDNGYNIGIERKNIIEIKILERKKKKEDIKKQLKDKKGLKKILILHTGGTIASKIDYETGGVIAKFSAEDILEMVPELSEIANIDSYSVFNIMSEDINFSEYCTLIKEIKKNHEKYNGIIIGHGTDTLGYTAAALSFALENINIPILLVGSQRSSDRPSSDFALNLLCAARFIVNSNFKGVAICMHHTSNDDACAILPPTKTRKMHTTRRDAFRAVNDTPIALVWPDGKIEFLKRIEQSSDRFICKDKFSDKVTILKTYPNFSPKLLKFMTKNYDGIIVEATGLGHMPTNTKENLQNYETLKEYIRKGGIMGITSQCLFGRLHPSVYSNLRRLSDIGCIFCEDMLPETAYIKLSWLLGNYSKEEARKLLSSNLRGEIALRTIYQEEYIDNL